eukprot:Colp12_sorted_trinity150504_noHs@27933
MPPCFQSGPQNFPKLNTACDRSGCKIANESVLHFEGCGHHLHKQCGLPVNDGLACRLCIPARLSDDGAADSDDSEEEEEVDTSVDNEDEDEEVAAEEPSHEEVQKATLLYEELLAQLKNAKPPPIFVDSMHDGADEQELSTVDMDAFSDRRRTWVCHHCPSNKTKRSYVHEKSYWAHFVCSK